MFKLVKWSAADVYGLRITPQKGQGSLETRRRFPTLMKLVNNNITEACLDSMRVLSHRDSRRSGVFVDKTTSIRDYIVCC